MFPSLDPLLHSQLRLAIISLLAGVKDAEFNYIKEKTESTSGNLSVQLTKLKEAGYVNISKQFKGNYPLTICSITALGKESFENYVAALEKYIGNKL
jgi:DNA-binding transcriptional ArsR family regulator